MNPLIRRVRQAERTQRPSLRVSPQTRRRLTREAGKRTAETGERWSIERLITDLADKAGVPREQ